MVQVRGENDPDEELKPAPREVVWMNQDEEEKKAEIR